MFFRMKSETSNKTTACGITMPDTRLTKVAYWFSSDYRSAGELLVLIFSSQLEELRFVNIGVKLLLPPAPHPLLPSLALSPPPPPPLLLPPFPLLLPQRLIVLMISQVNKGKRLWLACIVFFLSNVHVFLTKRLAISR